MILFLILYPSSFNSNGFKDSIKVSCSDSEQKLFYLFNTYYVLKDSSQKNKQFQFNQKTCSTLVRLFYFKPTSTLSSSFV